MNITQSRVIREMVIAALMVGSAAVGLSADAGQTAVAPDSIAGKVYRDSFVLRGLFRESTIVFEDGAHFTSLLQRYVNSGHIDYNMRILPPKPNGTYRFTRTASDTATVDLSYEDGTTGSMSLRFTSASGGYNGDGFLTLFTLSDLKAAQNAAARNVSMRGNVSPGHPLVAGLIVPAASEVLVRAVGPSLRPFGVTNPWLDPDFQVFSGDQPYMSLEKHYGDWDAPDVHYSPDSPGLVTDSAGPGLQKVFAYVSAFPLQPNSKDAADVIRLKPGNYTIVCATGAGDAGGEVLIEVYFLP